MLLNYQNPIKEVTKYAAIKAPSYEHRKAYHDSLMKSKSGSIAMCKETYTGEEFVNCQNKVEYAYLILENLPNTIDRMEFQGVKSEEMKTKAENEARKIAFSFVKSAFNFDPNNS